ncbi:THAP domain-containing protein 9 [Trachymyrmex cornetzi]|uniref:THAP domain-containing protein 9 n=1 Tax=Trachymyrmex cornetzi TaxID=471704 RepID=A0A151JBK3_9HYME|nr:THAP domain-containing protein 9 [Trachymyrmex cornetzi]
MAIKQQIIWDEQEHRFVGYCDNGNGITLERNESEAKEALVFLLVSLNGKWKWPIAYFFKRSITAPILKELIETALILTAEVQISVRSITCDGDSVNCSVFRELGCNIFVDNFADLENSFPHPTLNYNVRILLDACHMLKLCRNALADYGIFNSVDGQIKWSYIRNLHNVQQQLTFKFKNRLNAQCVEWWQNKMKVRYAAHTLSASVANAIKFLKKVGLKEFQDCDVTVKFIEIIDWLFDVLNSRNPFGKGFKQPLTKNRLTYLKEVIPEKINYLFNLEAKDGTKLIKTGRRTFIYGFALALKSILEVAEDIFNERPHYKYLLTYKFSQDHAEILFGKIRSRHGFNNNPNVLQFKYAMKQILMRNDIKTNSTGLNSLELDNDPTGAVLDIVWKKKNDDRLIICEDIDSSENLENEQLSKNLALSPTFDMLKENIIFYVAGYIIRKLKNMIDCYHCYDSLIQKQEHNYDRESFSDFVKHSTRGGLLYASKSVHKILLETEKQIQIETLQLTNLQTKGLDLKIINKVRRALVLDNTIFPNLLCDDWLLETSHKMKLITVISSKYIKIRLHSYAKFYVENILHPKRKRHRLTKQILFLNE